MLARRCTQMDWDHVFTGLWRAFVFVVKIAGLHYVWNNALAQALTVKQISIGDAISIVLLIEVLRLNLWDWKK